MMLRAVRTIAVFILIFVVMLSCGCLQQGGEDGETEALPTEITGTTALEVQTGKASENAVTGTQTGGIQPEFVDEVDYGSVSPVEFLETLRQNPAGIYTVMTVPEGWLGHNDVLELVNYVDSEEPCATVVSPLSSYLPMEVQSTVGNEAAFLIEGYLKGRDYPPSLHSEGFERRSSDWYKNELENHWAGNLGRLCKCVYLRSPESPQLKLHEIRRHWVSAYDVWRVYDQKELETAVDAIDHKVCLWIDMDMVGELDSDWLYKKVAEEKYPVVLLGNANALYCFRDMLGVGSYISGPEIVEEDMRKEGYSIHMVLDMQETGGLFKASSILKGFPGSIEIRELNEVSRELLNGGEAFISKEVMSAEQVLRYKYWHMKSSPEDPERISGVINSLEGIYWSRLSELSETGRDWDLIMAWFAGRAMEGNEKVLRTLMLNRQGLDGALAESYSSHMGDILASKPEVFVRMLSGMDDADYQELLFFTRYAINGRKEILKKLDVLLDSSNLDEKETKIARELLGMESVTVETVEEFMDAVGPHTIIKLKPGTYRLDELPDKYGGNKYVRIQDERQGNCLDGKEVVIHDVVNMWIEGLGDERVDLVTAYQTANVLTFENSGNIYIDNLRMGHWPVEGGCSGGVAVFKNSNEIRITDTELFGCGTTGIELCNTNNVYFNHSAITSCTMNIMFLTNSGGVRFTNSNFTENSGTELVSVNNCEKVVFKECRFENNTAGTDTAAFFVIDCAYSPYVYSCEQRDIISNITVMDSGFIDNSVSFNQFVRTSDKSRESLTLKNNVFEGNSFDES